MEKQLTPRLCVRDLYMHEVTGIGALISIRAGSRRRFDVRHRLRWTASPQPGDERPDTLT